MEILFLNVFDDIYNLSLLISDRAFLPSLRVLKTSQHREEMIRKVSVIRDISVVSVIVNLLGKYFEDFI